jgi:ABC-type amino acid transport substrate-binding protein
VALRDGTSHIHYAKKLFPKAVIKTYSDWEPEAVEAVIRGDATVGITDETGLKEYLMSRPEAAIHVKTAIVDYLNDYIAMALPPKSYALKEWLDIYIEENVPELNADILLKRYSLGETANETNGFK